MADDKALAELVKKMRPPAWTAPSVVKAWADELESLIKPEPKWKAGQRLVSELTGTIYRLEKPLDADLWAASVWGKGWENLVVGVCFESGYVPWPRVGDWVRFMGETFKVHLLQDGMAFPFSGNGVAVGDLEPALPPEQPGQFSGPHWGHNRDDKGVSSFERDIDLRRMVETLQMEVKRLRG